MACEQCYSTLCLAIMPPSCGQIVDTACLIACQGTTSNDDTPSSSSSGSTSVDTGGGTGASMAAYCDDLCEAPDRADCSETGGNGDLPEYERQTCDPASCFSKCCCCDANIIIEQVSSRCFDRIVASCDSTGTKTDPRDDPFPPECESCASACNLILSGDCSSLPSQPWWTYGNVTCDCYCGEGGQTTADGGMPPNCNLFCARCGKCSTKVDIERRNCRYYLTLTPGDDCCGERGVETVFVSLIYVYGYGTSTSAATTALNLADVYLNSILASHPTWSYSSDSVSGIAPGAHVPPCGSELVPREVPTGETVAAELSLKIEQACINGQGYDRNEIFVIYAGCVANCSLHEPHATACLEPYNARVWSVVMDVAPGQYSVNGEPCTWKLNEYGDFLNPEMSARPFYGLHSSMVGYWPESGRVFLDNADDHLLLERLYDYVIGSSDHPSASCRCLDPSSYTFDVPARECGAVEVDVCGSTMVIDTDGDSRVCCERVNCTCGPPPCLVPPCDCPDPPCTQCDPCADPECRCRPGVDPNCVPCDPDTDPCCRCPEGDPNCGRPCNPEVAGDCGECVGDGCDCDPRYDTDCWCDPTTDPNCIPCDDATDPYCHCEGHPLPCGRPCIPEIETCEGKPDCDPEVEDCTPVATCPCGVDCTPVCGPTGRLFPSITSAIDAVWGTCTANAIVYDSATDCLQARVIDSNGNSVVRSYCKATIESQVRAAWDACGGECVGEGCGECPDPPCDTPCTGDDCFDPPDATFPDDQTISATACASCKNPDVCVLNNGVGLVAYEDGEAIRIRQFKSSLGHKAEPNRILRYGRLQHPTRWETSGGFSTVRLYHYDPVGTIDVSTNRDAVFFQNGPMSGQFFLVTSLGADDIGSYIAFSVPEGIHLTGSYRSDSDDRYDVRWVTMDMSDTGVIGDADDGDATKSDIDAILLLTPHLYNGLPVPVARPSIAAARNYDDDNENAHFVYVAYQALEEGRWKVYLRQLRLSEYKAYEDQGGLTVSNIETISDGGYSTVVWTCRGTCTTNDCSGDTKTVTSTSVWTAQTEDGRPVFNCSIPSGSYSVCGVTVESSHLAIVLTQQSTSATECPESAVMLWQRGDTRTTDIPPTDSSSLSTWAQDNFEIGVTQGDATILPISAELKTPWDDGDNWCTWKDTVIPSLALTNGTYISDPVLVAEGEQGNCTHPVLRVDCTNRVFVAYEEVIGGRQQIVLTGTGEPEESLPVGIASDVEQFDSAFDFFIRNGDFSYRHQVTSSGANQMPDMWIDMNDVIHLAWQSNTDKRWEIYYASSADSLQPVRITDSIGKSLSPSIHGDDAGNLHICWHDDRFGNWEIMMASYAASRVLPLYQQNEYLASLRNSYQHNTNLVPFTLVNETGTTICFTDIRVSFYNDRVLTSGPVATVKKSEYPFAFSENAGTGDVEPAFQTVEDTICLQPSESMSYTLTLAPDVFIDQSLGKAGLSVGLKYNRTYFIGVKLTLDDGTTLEMPDQMQSVSCTECGGTVLRFDYSACQVAIEVENDSVSSRYMHARSMFFSEPTLERLVETYSTVENIGTYRLHEDAATEHWMTGGLLMQAGSKVSLRLMPALSSSTGLLCGITYYIKSQVAFSDSPDTPGDDWQDLDSEAYRWFCDCQSARWSDDAPVTLADLARWRSSGFGLADTRITLSGGASLHPIIRFRNSAEALILYHTDRRATGVFEVYGSAFAVMPGSSMRATGTMRATDITDGPALQGIYPSFDFDQYGNVFLAYQSSVGSAFVRNQQTVVKVHRGRFSSNLSSQDVTSLQCSSDAILATTTPDDTFGDYVKLMQVRKDYMRYGIRRGGIATTVVDQCSIVIEVAGIPETVAVRLKNDEDPDWSEWFPVSPETGENVTEIPWTLTRGSGMKLVRMQAATYTGLSSNGSLSIVADYSSVPYEVRFYSDQDRQNLLGSFGSIPVASLKSADENGLVYVEIIPQPQYFSGNPSAPVFNVYIQGTNDQLTLPTVYEETEDGIKLYHGFFHVFADGGSNRDGVALLIPLFPDDCNVTASRMDQSIDQYNTYVDRPTAAQPLPQRDDAGFLKYRITDRPSEDPYMVFGDPDYWLKKE